MEKPTDTTNTGAAQALTTPSGSEYEPFGDEWKAFVMKMKKSDIIDMLRSTLKQRVKWHVGNAESLTLERNSLFRAGENMAAELCQWCPKEERGETLTAWDIAAQPIRDLCSQNMEDRND